MRLIIGIVWVFLAGCGAGAPPSVVAFGDSNTEQTNLPHESRWVNRLSELRQLRIVNAGIGGNTSSQGLKRIDDVLDNNPVLVLIMFGTNDAVMVDYDKPQVDKETFSDNIETIINDVRAVGAKPVLMTVIPMIEGNGSDGYYYSRHPYAYYSGHGGANALQNTYNDIIRDIATRDGVILVDQWGAFIKAAGGADDAHLIASGLFDKSGTHMTEKGARLVVEQLADL